MGKRRPAGLLPYVPLGAHVLVLSIVPLLFLVVGTFVTSIEVPLSQLVLSGETATLLATDPYYMEQVLYTISVALGVTLVVLAVAVPFSFALVSMGYRWRTIWLVSLLASLALSEVLAVFAWQIVLSKSSGLPGWLAALGLPLPDVAWWPSTPAMITVLVFFGLPVAVVVLFAPFARVDPSYAEAARTMGLPRRQVFWLVTWPMVRDAVIRAGVLVFLLTVGSFVISQQLGKPDAWTFPVLISDYMRNFDVSLAVGSSLLLLISVAAVVALVLMLASRGARRD